MKFTSPFSQISKSDANIAGGKGASLGEMTQAGIPVPPGFVVLAGSFEQFLKETDLNVEIESILHTVNHQEMHTVEHASERIQKLILEAKMPEDIASEIESEFKKLGAEFVAVRSSATAEDSASAAWAGQLDSFLNTNAETLLENVQKCWASLFTPRAVFYRFEKGLHDQKISVAVVVQKMVASEKSGIAFSVHPVTENRNQLIIEAGFGLGEAIVSGQITPDSYVVEKDIKNPDIENQLHSPTFYNGRDWILTVTRNMSFWHQYLGNMGFYYHTKDFDIPASFQLLTITEGGTHTSAFICQPNYGEYVNVVMRSVESEAQIESLKAHHQKNAGSLLDALGKMKAALDVKTLKAFFDEYQKFSAGLMITTVIGRAGGESLANKLRESGISDEKIPEIIGTVTYPKESTPLFVSHRELLEIALEVQEHKINEEETDARLKAWIGDYGHIPVNFCEEPWTAEDARSQMEDLLLKNCREEVSVLEKSHEMRQKNTVAMLATLSEDVRVLAQAIGEATYLNEFRKNVFSRVSLEYRPIFGKIAEMAGSKNWRDCFFLTPDEMIDIVEGKNIDISKIIKERTLVGLYVNNQGTQSILDSTISLRFQQEIKTPQGAKAEVENETSIIRGFSANKGIVRGMVKVILSVKDFSKLLAGEILVTTMTSVDFVPVMSRAGAFVTNEGGITSHASIVAREMNKPYIIGTKIATQVLHDGDMVEVDADNGIVKILEKSNNS